MNTDRIVTQADKDRWSAEYRGSAALQAEFQSEERYLAYMTHDAMGHIRRSPGTAGAR